MYKKVRLRLTLLCTTITTAIMIVMSFLYLRISESSLYENQLAVFENDVRIISDDLSRQKIITAEYLFRIETDHIYSFFLLDNGVPLLYHRLTGLTTDSGQALLNEIRSAYEKEGSQNTSFLFSSQVTKKNYFCSALTLEKGTSPLQMIVLFPLTLLEKQILKQRYFFLLIDAASFFLLLVFSWIFTGRLLKPISENQQQQIQFVASASHELRTPLSVLLTSAECLETDADDRQQGLLRNIRQAGLTMSLLIDDMLTLSLSDSHNLPMEKQQTELDTLLIDLYGSFYPLARQKSITLSLELPEQTVPACICDPKRISQAVSILLHNAISYTGEGGRITLSLSCPEKMFLITVTDNGIGISDEDKKKIFRRFYRAERSRNREGHFGLGLSIAYEIISAHRGSISVTDAPNSGSVFTVILPCEVHK